MAEKRNKPPAICVMGPTASGKTDLAIAIAAKLPVELISVDSALVYRGLNIGAAKPDEAVLSEYPHRLVDIREPATPYSAAEFRTDALSAMAEITRAGAIPLLVGGTMLYFRALLQGIAELPAANPKIRQQIDAFAKEHGWAAVHKELLRVDPKAAERIHPNDPQRLQRALEVYRISGQTLSALQAAQSKQEEFPYRLCQLAIAPWDRRILHQRIAQRFQVMLENGMIEEVRGLLEQGLDRELPALKAVGYRQVTEYLDGQLGYNQMVESGIVATRQLAKRQLTWLRSWPNVHWILSDDAQCCVLDDGTPFPDSSTQQRVDQRAISLVDRFLAADIE